MCNHYRTARPDVVSDFGRGHAEAIEATWETRPAAWPEYTMPVLYAKDGKRTLTAMRWGVWPWYAKGERPIGGFVSNARDDKLLASPLWKEAAKRRRCLVPADGWFEWCGPKGAKWEALFRFVDDRPFWIAGLWSDDPRGGGRGYTLVTSTPNELIAAVPHTRMIVLLSQEDAMRWIGSEPLPDEKLLSFCRPYPSDEMVREDMPRPVRKGKAPAKGQMPILNTTGDA